MSWKDLSYWFRGGIIGVVVGIISFGAYKLYFLNSIKDVFLISNLLIFVGAIAFMELVVYFFSFEPLIQAIYGVKCNYEWSGRYCDYGTNEILISLIIPIIWVILFSFLVGAIVGQIIKKSSLEKNI